MWLVSRTSSSGNCLETTDVSLRFTFWTFFFHLVHFLFPIFLFFQNKSFLHLHTYTRSTTWNKCHSSCFPLSRHVLNRWPDPKFVSRRVYGPTTMITCTQHLFLLILHILLRWNWLNTILWWNWLITKVPKLCVQRMREREREREKTEREKKCSYLHPSLSLQTKETPHETSYDRSPRTQMCQRVSVWWERVESLSLKCVYCRTRDIYLSEKDKTDSNG